MPPPLKKAETVTASSSAERALAGAGSVESTLGETTPSCERTFVKLSVHTRMSCTMGGSLEASVIGILCLERQPVGGAVRCERPAGGCGEPDMPRTSACRQY